MPAPGTSPRTRIRALLHLPDPTALRPTAARRQVLSHDDGILRERLELDTAEGDTIPCLLLTPDELVGVDVVAVHQHAGDFATGKREPAGLHGDATLAYGHALALQGARVVMPDLLGFEDRQRGWTDDAAADERLDALFRIADGDSLQAKHTRDVAVVTSWLCDADAPPTELGVIGHSLGGQVALFALAVDPRFTRGVVSCGLGTLVSFREHRIRHNPSWFVPGLAAAGDVRLVASAVTASVFVSAGQHDALFPLDGVRAVLDAFPLGAVTADVFDGAHALPPTVHDIAVGHLLGGRAAC